MSKSSLPSAAAALSLVLLVYPPSAEGQSEPDPPHTSAPNRVVSPPDWGGELAFLSGNAALGGLTAALIQELQGGSFWRAFLEGALGGAVVYGGKRIAVERFYAAGLVGRQLRQWVPQWCTTSPTAGARSSGSSCRSAWPGCTCGATPRPRSRYTRA